MLFKVTHIDPAGHCRKARVSAIHAGDAIDQMDRVYGDALVTACVRMSARPVLRLVGRVARPVVDCFKEAVCVL